MSTYKDRELDPDLHVPLEWLSRLTEDQIKELKKRFEEIRD